MTTGPLIARKLPPILSLLDSCTHMNQLKQIHAHIIIQGLSRSNFTGSRLIAFCAVSPYASIDHAKLIFAQIQEPSIFTWNSMIRGLSMSSNPKEAIVFYSQLLCKNTQPNNFTFPFVIKACTEAAAVETGLLLHNHVIKLGLELDAYVLSSLIHMYASGGKIDAAIKLFAEASEEEVVSWNAMIDGYVKSRDLQSARSIFDRMQQKDVVSWNTMMNGYANFGLIEEALILFDKNPKKNTVSWNAMIAGYTKCGDVENARKFFDQMPKRDVISWNSMLACYAQSSRSNEALNLFKQMLSHDIRPTEATVVSVLSACAHLGALDQGKWVHNYIDREKVRLNAILGTALLDMYVKCGNLGSAVKVFEILKEKDVLAWNTMIAGFAMNGYAEKAMHLFVQMHDMGFKPDDLTFVGMLSACSHAGWVDDGCRILKSMCDDYGIEPKVEHYGCVIDLLGRAGLLDEAIELISSMPMEPNASAWGALLGGCRIHGDVELGEWVGRRLIELEPHHSGRYVLLSNIYAAANRWEDAKRVRNMMKARGVAKSPGWSMIEIKGIVHQFLASDRMHHESEAIYAMLNEITKRLRTEGGYEPDTKQVLFDIGEEEKEHALSVHSEKLAIAFGFLHLGSDEVIRIVKNLRVCGDCHSVTKMISRVYKREIVVRDRNRFHHFKDGVCSCMDYW